MLLVNICYITYNRNRGDIMGVDKEKNTQVLVTLPNEMLEEIEKHWHKHCLKNRSEAIREIITIGLQTVKSRNN